MQRQTVASLLAGFVALPALVVTGFVALPTRIDRAEPEPAAWLWSSAPLPIEELPLAKPAVGEGLQRAGDGALLVIAQDKSAQRFDPAAKKFLAPAPVTPPAKRALPEGYPPSTLLDGDAGLWIESSASGLRRSTFLQRGDAWREGPQISVRGDQLHAVKLAGARIAVLASDMDGPQLFVAGEADPSFTRVALHGQVWQGLVFVAGAAGDADRLLVLLWAYGPLCETRAIDVQTGDVTNGAPFELPDQASGTWRAYADAVPGGGLLWIGNGMRHELEHPRQNILCALLLFAELAGLGILFAKRWIAPGRFALGVLLGVLPLFALFLHSLSTVHI